MSHSHLSMSKLQGGLGLRDLESFNLALLSKLAWRLMHSPQVLWVRVLKGIYFPNSSFFDASLT